MSTDRVRQSLQATGFAQVIVVLAQPAAAGNAQQTMRSVEKHFRVSEASQNSALAAAAEHDGNLLGATRSSASVVTMPGGIPAGDHAPAVIYYPNLGIALGTVNREGFDALRADKVHVEKVESAPVLSLIRPNAVTAARLTGKTTWGITMIGAPVLWRQGIDGTGVLVGHLDTGVDGQHPALRTAIQEFAEFDLLGREIQPKPAPHDTDEHGTHTAATILGRAVNGRAVGVAPGAMLASALVIEGGNVIARVLGGLDWVVGQNVKIVSMSLGIRGFFGDFLPVMQILRARNILPVFAVGNEGPGTSRSPGNYTEPISVGACDRRGAIPGFSSSQRFSRQLDSIVPDVIAPGVNVISARPGGGYQAMDGSSMATPHVAGLAALLFQGRPDATANQVEKAIYDSCELPASMDPDRGNRGIPNASRALAALRRA